jgi:membrane associated rhomboid family serine protease
MNAPPGQWLHQGRPRLGLVFLAAALVSTGMLLIDGARPPHSTQAPFSHFDKVLHFGAHGWISALLFTGLVLLARPRALLRRAWLVATAVVLADGLAGVGVEVVQYTLGAEHGRQFDWKDIVANLGGTLCAVVGGLLVVLWLRRRYKGSNRPQNEQP